MTRKSLLVLGLIAATAIGGAAYAAGSHGAGGRLGDAGMTGNHADMMNMMMRMHGQMMGDTGGGGMMGGMGGPGMMGGMGQQMMGGTDGGGMMGGMGGPGMMAPMHQQMMGGMGSMHSTMLKGLDSNGDGNLTPDEARDGLRAKLTEYDADGDGALSIAEFEVLHSAMIREAMVDRYQHLDGDGDGKVTADEIIAPAERLERMQTMRTRMHGAAEPDAGNHGGSMMTDN